MKQLPITHLALALAVAVGSLGSASAIGTGSGTAIGSGIGTDSTHIAIAATTQQREPLLQGINLSTNLLLWGLGSINLGAQLPFADRWQLGIDGAWGGWPLSGNTRGVRLSTLGVEVRRYFCPDANTDQQGFGRLVRADRGLFLGLDLRTSHFNHRPHHQGREGNLVSLGLVGGYSWNFAHGWGIDLSVGAGYRHARYEEYAYYAPLQVNAWQGDGRSNRLGITRAEVSLVYRFEL